jgi:ABC-type phosphate transport system permease subunit
MTTLTAVCAFGVIAVLVFVLGYIAFQGISSLSWQFLVQTPETRSAKAEASATRLSAR